MNTETKIPAIKTNTIMVDDMEISTTGKFNVPQLGSFIFQEENTNIMVIDEAVLKIDTIGELTTATGVTIDSVLVKDGGIEIVGAQSLKTDKIEEKTSAEGIELADYIKLSANPCFIMHMGANKTGMVDGEANTVVFDTSIVNLGSHFNVATYMFTAPVDGVYEFDTIIHMDTVTDPACTIKIELDVTVAGITSHILWEGLGDPLALTGHDFIINGSKRIKLLATAKVKVVVTATDEGGDTVAMLAAQAHFGGRLVTMVDF